ncbi:unnamed protein product [Scytosiphon promiscuus]
MQSLGFMALISAVAFGAASGFSCTDDGGTLVSYQAFVLCCTTSTCDNDESGITTIDNYCDVTDTIPCIVQGYAECDGHTSNHYWIGDGWCDADNNNEACGWDYGDCCQESCCSGQTYECGDDGPGYDCQDTSPEYTACGSGVDARERTTVTQTSTAYDARDEASGGCDPSGCTHDYTRDQSWDDDSRWSCSEQLNNVPCAITYSFATAQDIGRLKINFHKGDERVRSLTLSDNTGWQTTITSSGTTAGFESFDIFTDETATLTMEANNLGTNDWLSITEVEFMVD